MATESATRKKMPPVRLATIFAQMVGECPLDIQVYGKCVADIHGGVNRFACEKEFQKLRVCFQRVVRARRV
ncbi:hypothetical protein CCR75_001629 [Bremia lactucae]|uniref:Uncharacterized protein n=1 Tax=Bremia lactucae TaxID=4779 RepID=A0A976FNS3_BRELC|nr:hypothetical protein CCR75_001629 [Bremia lactucae]